MVEPTYTFTLTEKQAGELIDFGASLERWIKRPSPLDDATAAMDEQLADQRREEFPGVLLRLDKLEIAASLAAVRAVADSGFEAMGAGSFPLTTAAEKFQKALDELNGDTDA